MAERVAGFSIDRGRAYELDRTETSTAKVSINDVDGTFDPTNASGPYYGQLEPLLQMALAIQNPITLAWSTLYRGYIEDYDYDLDPSQQVNRLNINLVDMFEILSAIEMQPGEFGDPPPLGSEGNIYFEAASAQTRILQVLGNAGIPVDLTSIFTMNVNVQPSVYSPGDSVLQVVQDAVDAEYPGLGNAFVEAIGRLAAHGRFAKFDPVGVSFGTDWDFTHWKCGDGTAVLASPSDTAHIRGMAFNRGLSKIINSALCTPNGIEDDDIAGQVVTDPTSIGTYGIRSWSAENLFTLEGTTTGNTGLQETRAFAEFYVTNFAQPRNRISQLTFRSMRLDTVGAAANWALLCGVEIGDMIDVTVDHPGGGGFAAEEFFVEGIHYEVEPANEDYHSVTLTLDVSPAAYFTDMSMLS